MKFFVLLLALSVCFCGPLLGGYQSVSVLEAQTSTQIQSFIQQGLQTVVQAGSQKGDFSNTNFALQQINSVQQQLTNAQSYQFNCNFQNTEGLTIQADFTVAYNAFTSTTSVTSYSYSVISTTFTQSVQQSYVQVQTSEVQHSVEIQDALDFGFTQLLSQAANSGQLSGSNYQIQDIKSVSRQVSGSAIFYKYNVEIAQETNIQSTSTEATFNVYYQPTTNQLTLVDYSLGDKDHEVSDQSTVVQDLLNSIGTQFTQVNVEQAQQNEATTTCLDYGLQQIQQIGLSTGKLTTTGFTVSSVQNVETSVAGNGVFYKFNAQFMNSQQTTIQAVYTVYYQASTGQTTLSSYNCDVKSSSGSATSFSSENYSATSIATNSFNFTTLTSSSSSSSSSSLQNTSQISSDLGGFSDGFLESLGEFGSTGTVETSSGNEEEIIVATETGTSSTSASQSSSQTSSQSSSLAISNQVSVSSNVAVNYVDSGSITTALSNSQLTTSSSSSTSTQTTTTSASTIKTGYSGKLTEAQIKGNKQVQDAISYGISQIYQIGVRAGKIRMGQYSISNYNSVVQKTTRNRISYTCKLTLTGQNSVITETFTVTSSISGFRMTSYNYDTKNSGSSGNNNNVKGQYSSSYTQLTSTQIQKDSYFQSSLTYGVNTCIQIGIQEGKIPSSQYNVQSVSKVSAKSEKSKNYYQVEAMIQNAVGVQVSVSFTVEYALSAKKTSLVKYKYNVSNIPTATSITYIGANTSTSSSTSTSTSTQTTTSEYTQVQKSEYDYSSEIQSCLQYGIQNSVQEYSQYSKTTVNSVSRQVVNSALNYKFNVTLSNSEGKSIVTNFIVQNNAAIQQKVIIASSYKVFYSSQSSSTSTSTTTTTSSSSSSSSSSSISSSSGYWSSSSYSYSSSSTSTTSSTFTSTSSSSSYYSSVSVSTAQESSSYQNVLNSGVQQCLDSLVASNFIGSSSDFQVSQITSVYQQETSSATNYQYQVVLTNLAGINLNVNLGMEYQSKTKTTKLLTYSVQGVAAGQNTALIADYSSANGGQVDVGTCQQITNEQLQSQTSVQEAIQSGASQVSNLVISQNSKLSKKSTFKISKIQSVYQDVVNTNYYRVAATLVNDQGVSVDASYSVYAQSKSVTLNTCSYYIKKN